jgi:hypothetical protein
VFFEIQEKRGNFGWAELRRGCLEVTDPLLAGSWALCTTGLFSIMMSIKAALVSKGGRMKILPLFYLILFWQQSTLLPEYLEQFRFDA